MEIKEEPLESIIKIEAPVFQDVSIYDEVLPQVILYE